MDLITAQHRAVDRFGADPAALAALGGKGWRVEPTSSDDVWVVQIPSGLRWRTLFEVRQ